MTMESHLEELKYGLAFSAIIYSIKKIDQNLSDTTRFRIRDVNNLLSNVMKGIEVVLGEREISDFDISKTKSVREILRAGGYDMANPSKADVEEMKRKVEERICDLEQLAKNPGAFYDCKNSYKLLDFCKGLERLYSPKPQRILD